MFSAHPAVGGRGALRQFDIMPLPYSLRTSRCHLFLCPRLRHLWAGRCWSNQLLPWGSAPAVHAHIRRSFGFFHFKRVSRASIQISPLLFLPPYLHMPVLQKPTFLVYACIITTTSSSYNCCCLANALAKKCSNFLRGFYVCEGETGLI